jgi:hypothetical protein
LPTRSQQCVPLARTTPLNLVHFALVIIENEGRQRFIGLPQANQVLRTATREDFIAGIPFYLLNFITMAIHPNLLRCIRLINVPKVYLLTFSCDCKALVILPIDLNSFEIRVESAMIQFRIVFRCIRIPNRYD